MWRSSTTSARTTPSPPASPKTPPHEQNASPSPRRRPILTQRPSLSEVFKASPFKSNSVQSVNENRPKTPPIEDPVIQLNHELRTFARIYPDVKVEVLRELLQRFDGESRLHISTEQLIKYKNQWTRGRILNPPRDSDASLPIEELFRSKSYITASKRVLAAEFRSLNRSVIDAVLAEVNQSYSKARPILQGIAAKSWRATITSLFRRKKGADEVPTLLVEKKGTESVLHCTGDGELDQELESLFFTGPRRQRQKLQEQADNDLAITVNQQEAEEAQALFECQVCYNDVTFESIVTCTGDAHAICRDCVRRSMNEAIFGQSWTQSVDTEYGTLRCVAPDAHEACTGHVPPSLLQLTVVSSEAGHETWNKFEQRLATENMRRSGLSLVQCLFCHYAETPETYTPTTIQTIKWQFRKQELSVEIILLVLLAEFVLPTFLLICAFVWLIAPGLPYQIFGTSLINAHRLVQTRRFRCKNPTCARVSCLSCSKPWHDPHVCHEPLILSLRTAVEAARTAALKRTCPRCGTSFIKSSGCNKLTCVCGYAMCYLCRKNIGKVNNGGAVDDREGGEGYRHFCEHFRPTLGQKCTECNKCDLYMNEDDELVVKKAGEEAEKEWRKKEGMVGVKGLGLEEAVGNLGKIGQDSIFADVWSKFVVGDWTFQGISDWIVSKTIIIES